MSSPARTLAEKLVTLFRDRVGREGWVSDVLAEASTWGADWEALTEWAVEHWDADNGYMLGIKGTSLLDLDVSRVLQSRVRRRLRRVA
jgi:hypothetical protein